MRICLRCLLYVPEFKYLPLRKGLAHYGVKEKATKSYPIFEGNPWVLFKLLSDAPAEEQELGSVNKRRTRIILRRTIIMLSAKNGRVVEVDDYTSSRYLGPYYQPFPGCIKV
jgi:hypothetical protein